LATYAIGDVQGCLQPLLRLLAKISFEPKYDQLWFVGDLVNRGPASLEVLRFIKSLGGHAKVVLGNHDLHLLAVHYGVRQLYPDDTVQDILNAPDRMTLIDWLRCQTLAYYDPKLKFAMVHAGFAPMWDLQHALGLAEEVRAALQSEVVSDYLQHMYGNEPPLWDEALTGFSRLRVITNYLTRMRFCDAEGRLDLHTKARGAEAVPPGFYPWFLVPGRKTEQVDIVFGHWAALEGQADHPHVFALDTGVVWGRYLTAMCLETRELFTSA
jgi:bis(5'-nucleosyl)-tetraphosphatase (symmetrical)